MDFQPDQNAICQPAPVRFTRKGKPTEKMDDGSSADGKATRSEPPYSSPQIKYSLIPVDDPDDDLLEALMNCCELDHDRCPWYMSAVRQCELCTVE
jgi:hypothetical protein